MTEPWDADAPGMVQLPTGALIRGRGLRDDLPRGPTPTLTVHLTGRRPDEPPCESQWVQWRDFWLPSDPDDAIHKLRSAYNRAPGERVEVVCGGGIGRTGTGLATMCVFEGMKPTAAVDWVRKHYHPRAIEVPWQRWFLGRVWAAKPDGLQDIRD